RRFIAEHKLNEVFAGEEKDLGIIVQGGLYNGLMLALKTLGLADAFGQARIPILALNCVYPLVPEEMIEFAKTKKAVLVLEEGQPEFIEQEIATVLRRADVPGKLHGKDVMHMAGDYNVETRVRGLSTFITQLDPPNRSSPSQQRLDSVHSSRSRAGELLVVLPMRPP